MTESMTTDVLVVGGSIAGLAAAITAKEKDPALDVTVVEKYTSGYSGKANRGAGIMLILGDSTPEEFAQFYLKHIGLYLNNQNALLKYASMLNGNADALDKWSGGKIDKGEDGKFRTLEVGAQGRWARRRTASPSSTRTSPTHGPWWPSNSTTCARCASTRASWASSSSTGRAWWTC